MGAGFHFSPGPILEEPVIDLERVHQLKIPNPEQDLKIVGNILSGLKTEIGRSLPILGFAGAPVTLALFMIAGKSPQQKMGEVIQYMDDQPLFTQTLLDKLTSVTIDYLNYQIDCGANAVQLFESFADSMPKDFYQRWAYPCHEKIFSAALVGGFDRHIGGFGDISTGGTSEFNQLYIMEELPEEVLIPARGLGLDFSDQ